ncbi:MAG: phage baseplate assembly protein V [Alphaproteobacteria bacterium]|nr:MAG: phage baseplate assembly protein V [Alphaproteobacteria bacterium]
MREDHNFEGDMGDLVNFGTIAEVDLARGMVRVDTGDVQSDWVRFSTGRAGATRIWSPPTVGEQVALHAPSGDLAGAYAIGGFHSDDFPPAGDSLRELIQFGDGALIAYDPEAHALEAHLPDGATVSIIAAGGVTIDASDGGLSIVGDVTIEGELHVTGDIGSDADVLADTVSLKDHKHTGVSAGGGISGKPVQ